MADLSLDLNKASSTYRDLLFANADLVLTSDANPNGTQAVEQNILQRLRFVLGEWFLDLTQGLPIFQRVLVKNPSQSDIDAIFLNAIAGTPGVIQISSYSFLVDRPNRILTTNFSCVSTQGIINYNGNIAPISGGNV